MFVSIAYMHKKCSNYRSPTIFKCDWVLFFYKNSQRLMIMQVPRENVKAESNVIYTTQVLNKKCIQSTIMRNNNSNKTKKLSMFCSVFTFIFIISISEAYCVLAYILTLILFTVVCIQYANFFVWLWNNKLLFTHPFSLYLSFFVSSSPALY